MVFAHDFNNSLGVIIGQIELAISKQKDEHVLKNLQVALQAASQSETVVRQLTAYSRNQPLQSKVVFVDKHIEDNYSVLNSSLGEKHQLKLYLASQSAVYIDIEKLISVLLNLVINARDAMEQGGEISIITERIQRRRSGDNVVLISVQDTGLGIPSDIIENIFDPFFSTKPTGEGSVG